MSRRVYRSDGGPNGGIPIGSEQVPPRFRQDSDFAAEYLKAALEDADEPRVLLISLRHLVQAQGIAKVAKAAGIERESLYRALSAQGNPRLSTLVAVTKAIGLGLTVEAAPKFACVPPRIPGQHFRYRVPSIACAGFLEGASSCLCSPRGRYHVGHRHSCGIRDCVHTPL
jgi:probable addiction module antidote protein